MHRIAQANRLRKGRYTQKGGIYHITVCTWKKMPYFREFAAGMVVAKNLSKSDPKLETLCYVVMPDHFHWLFQISGIDSLSALVQKLKSVTTKELREAGLAGPYPVWQKGFYDHALRQEEDVVNVARYIVANPIRAGLVRSVREYPLWNAKWL